jgi:hypothetical protein
MDLCIIFQVWYLGIVGYPPLITLVTTESNDRESLMVMNYSSQMSLAPTCICFGGPSWSWSYGSWIYNYLCNLCLLPPTLWVWIPPKLGVLDTTLCDKVCQWLATGRRFTQCTPVSSTNKTDCHHITEILLNVALNTIPLIPNPLCFRRRFFSSPDPKGHVRYCHHLASVVRPSSVR